MGIHRWPAKDPDEVLDYAHDWVLRLTDGDTIVGSPVVEAEGGGITIVESSISGAVQTIWISGGVTGQTAIICLRITTIGGRIHEENISLTIRDGGS